MLAPQQNATPLLVSAQVWLLPELTVVHGSEQTGIGRQWPLIVQIDTSGGVRQSRCSVTPLLGTSLMSRGSSRGTSLMSRGSLRPHRISSGSNFTGLPYGS